jgi:hypothetical protein
MPVPNAPVVPPGNPENLLPGAPYGDGTTLHSPLSAAQKAGITAFLIANGYAPSVFGTVIKTDANYIAAYKAVAVGGSGQTKKEFDPTIPGVSSVVDFLKLLANRNTWIRVGEFTIGAILLAVGVNAMLKQGLGANAPQIRPPKTGFSYARKALP